jgi:glycolate oxidase FAD binding subunit
MISAIATQLKSIIDRHTELIELSQANAYWQTKISQAVSKTSEPIYLVFPQTIDILTNIVKMSSQHQWRMLICGHGSKLAWGKPSQDIQLVISIEKCDRLIEHAVGDLTITVEAGMKLVDLQAKLRSHNQFLPIDANYPDATLGGIVATADTGSWRERYGGIRDLLLGLSFVRADGAVAKAGGRVVKNVAGYDLMKLFTGAYGTLGIISQLTFRTYPLIPTSQTLLLTGQAAAIAQASQTIRNSGLTPTRMDLLSAGVIEQLGLGKNMGLIARWQTIPESIQQQVEQVKAIAIQLDLATNDYQEQAEIDLWQQCTAITSLPNSAQAVTCKIGIAPTAVGNFLQLEQIMNNNLAVRIHASSGVGRLQLNQVDNQIINQIRSYCQKNYGFLTILDAPQITRQQLDVWGYQGNGIKTMKAIKNQFDPQNILNCDRFIV